MKRIDLHIHTIASNLDEEFKYSPDVLFEHVRHNALDIIAITNHNLFNRANYEQTLSILPDSVCVLPGIEVSVKSYHVLVVANPDEIDKFSEACNEVPSISQSEEGISLEDFMRLFGDGSYIIIPHFKKRPAISSDDLKKLGNIVDALEVTSHKKWHREQDRVDKPVVIFSDFRCAEGAHVPWGKYTYVAMGSTTFDSLRLTLKDKSKFSISERKDHLELGPNLYASMGLNVVMGGRSTGKTYFLDRLNSSCDPDDVVYVPQFGIVKDAEEKAFKEKLDAEESAIKSAYYEPMNAVSSAVMDLPSREEIQNSIKEYLSESTEFAESSARDDEYSKCPIYSEGRLPQVSVADEKKVVDSIITLLEDKSMSAEIASVIGRDPLIELLRIAIARYKEKIISMKRIDRANEIAKRIKKSLTVESSRPACPESPLMNAAKRRAHIKRLSNLRSATKEEKMISEKTIGKFKRTTKRIPYRDATALRKALSLGSKASLAGVLQLDDEEFVERILAVEGVSDISHSLFDIDVTLENERGEEVSGGQRAEYLFFKALDRASSNDIVLIDEPESSFDNPFLNELIATELKKISRKATVFIATHNNVLGVSIKPDGIVYTDVDDGQHRIFTCDSADEFMIATDGTKIKRSDVLMRQMEAGANAYENRRPYYGLA